MEVIPTILTADIEELKQKLAYLKGKGGWVQVDVIDGKFADNKTFPLEALNDSFDESFYWDLHLMVDNPFSWIERCSLVFAQRISAHIERMGSQVDFIDRVKSEGIQAGLGVDLLTPIADLNPDAVYNADMVLLLSVKAGFPGQKFDSSVMAKLDELITLREDLQASFQIGMDGGIKKEHLPFLEQSGVDIVYMGTSYWSETGLGIRPD